MQGFEDDNCEICKVVKLAESEGREPSFSELQAAMMRQKASGIGWFGSNEDLDKY
jgi:hypothetical protein